MFNPVCFVDVNNPLHKLPQSWGEWCKGKIKSLRHIRDTYKALSPINKEFLIVKEIIFQERRYQEKPIFQGLQKLWNAVRCAGIYIECNTYAAGMQQRY